MQGNRSRDTAPELAVRRLVHAMDLRYRVNARPLPTLRRTADLVFTRQRVAEIRVELESIRNGEATLV